MRWRVGTGRATLKENTSLYQFISELHSVMPLLRPLAAALTAVLVSTHPMRAAAQRATPPQPSGAGVSGARVYGVVYDSVAARPLGGAVVQLVGTDSLANVTRTSVSDSAGQFTFERIPVGQYTVGFFHPVLDSLGLDPIARAVTVRSAAPLPLDLAVPSPQRVRAAICGAPAGTGAVLIGSVYEAFGKTPVAGVSVIAEWIELTIGASGITRRMPRRITTTRENGWFFLCNVPGPGVLMLMATRGADSTAMIEVQVPATGLQRRELYLGSARRVANASDSTRATHVGDGHLSGVVRAVTDNRALADAQIRIVDGPQTRTNARGEWTLTNAPPGTRMLEVRAVGFYPDRRAVDIVDSSALNRSAPIRSALATFSSVLDTMKINATRTVDMNMVGFQERRRSSVGRFLTPSDIAVRQPFVTSEIFRSVQGLFLDRTMDAEEKIMMRGVFEDRCEPAIFVNGQWMNGLSSADLDGFIRPTEIAGIEVYMAGQVPAQFQPGLGGCGSLVFWTK